MRVSAAIMAHPERRELVDQLLAALDRPVSVVWDEDGRPPSGRGDRLWAVARRVWLSHDPEADWHVLIQDDALVCADFLAGLEKALDHVPADALVSPYLGTGRTVPGRWRRMADRAEREGAVWIRSNFSMWGVCLALPVRLIAPLVEWADRRAGVPDDMRVSSWYRRQRLDTWYTWPSLVDHRPGISLAGHRHVNRVAARHHQGSALEIDWAGPVVVDPMVIRHRGLRSRPTGG